MGGVKWRRRRRSKGENVEYVRGYGVCERVCGVSK